MFTLLSHQCVCVCVSHRAQNDCSLSADQPYNIPSIFSVAEDVVHAAPQWTCGSYLQPIYVRCTAQQCGTSLGYLLPRPSARVLRVSATTPSSVSETVGPSCRCPDDPSEQGIASALRAALCPATIHLRGGATRIND